MFSVNGMLHSFFQPKRELQIIFSIKIIFGVINVTKHPFKRAYFLTLIEKLHLPKHKVIVKSVYAPLYKRCLNPSGEHVCPTM